MPKVWTQKDERPYQHIKDNLMDEGKSENQAEEIAARNATDKEVR